MSVTTTQAMRDGILAMLNYTTDTGVWASLIALWELDDGVGSSYATDEVAGAQALTSTATYGATGKVGYGATFTASGMAVYSAGLAGLSGDFSFAVWLKPNELPGAGSPLIPLLIGTGGDTGFRFTDASAVEFIAAGVTVAAVVGSWITAGTYQHYVVTRTSGTYAIYRNGAALGLTTSVNSTTSYANEQISFGNFRASGTGGTLDQVAFWSRALSAGEVSTLYGAGSGYVFTTRQLLAPVGPFQEIGKGPFTPADDPITILERMSELASRMPSLWLSAFPISQSVGDESRPAPGRIMSYDETWLLAAIFPTLRDDGEAGSREAEVWEWRSRVRLALEQRFVTGVPATPSGWEFRFARFGPISGVWLPEAYVETVTVSVKADSVCRTDV